MKNQLLEPIVKAYKSARIFEKAQAEYNELELSEIQSLLSGLIENEITKVIENLFWSHEIKLDIVKRERQFADFKLSCEADLKLNLEEIKEILGEVVHVSDIEYIYDEGYCEPYTQFLLYVDCESKQVPPETKYIYAIDCYMNIMRFLKDYSCYHKPDEDLKFLADFVTELVACELAELKYRLQQITVVI